MAIWLSASIAVRVFICLGAFNSFNLHCRRCTVQDRGGFVIILNNALIYCARYRDTSGGQPMRAFYLEITAKLIVRSNADPDDLPAEIYSRMAEFIPSDDDIIDIEVNAVPLPPNLCGSTPH